MILLSLLVAALTLSATLVGTPLTAAAETAPAPSAIEPGAVERSSLDLRATYDVDLRLDSTSGAMVVVSTMSVTNTSGGPIDRLELNTVAARLGRLRLVSVTVDDRPATARIDDQTLVVPLGGFLPDGATTTVRLAFWATLRNGTSGSDWLFTRAGGVVAAYRWLPWVSRRVRFDRPNYGDPFVTPVSPSVRVRITTDRPMPIATSGRRIATSGLTQTFVARDVRDFAITASPRYRIVEGTAGRTRVRVYYLPGAPASALLRSATRALARMERLVGPYPYPVYSVAQTVGGYGMEAPALSWVPSGVAASRLPYLVSHETAHQWFYSLVGNDQASEPFADEATADFLARYVLEARRVSRCPAGRLDRPITGYAASCYYEVVYIQGGNLLDDVRQRMGDAAFWAALRGYLADYRFGIAGTRALLEALDAGTAEDLSISLSRQLPRYYRADDSAPRGLAPRGRSASRFRRPASLGGPEEAASNSSWSVSARPVDAPRPTRQTGRCPRRSPV